MRLEPVRVNFVMAVLLVAAATAAGAQCGLDARNEKNVPLPVLGTDVMSPALAAELKQGYQMSAVELRNAEGDAVLKSAEQHALAEHNVCAQGLAVFGQALAARVIHLPDALPLFEKAEGLLGNGVATPLTMAYLHERIAGTQHALGHNAIFLRDDPAIREELRQAGDIADAIAEQSVAYQWGTEVELPSNQEKLFEELKSVEAPNATAARGFVQWEWGSNLRRTGKFADSMVHFHAAQALLEKCDCQISTQGTLQLEMALTADSQSDADSVIRYALAGDAIYKKYHLDVLRPQALRVLSNGYRHKSDVKSMIAVLEESMRLAREMHLNSVMATTGDQLAGAYGDAGEPLRGIALLKSTQSEHPSPLENCTMHGRLQSLQGQAKLYADAVVTALEAQRNGCEKYLAPLDFANLEWILSDSEQHVGQLDDALKNAKDAVALVEVQRTLIEQTDANLTAFTAKQSAAYTVLINALAKMNRADEALLASEQYRARAFVDLARSKEVQQASADGKMMSLRSEARPFALKVEDLRAIVTRERSTLVSYWLTGEGELYTWVMRPNEPVVQVAQDISPERLREMVNAVLPGNSSVTRRTRGAEVRTRGGNVASVAAGSRKPWQDLYTLLLAPIENKLPKEQGSLLTIVPQDVLFNVPFAALMDAKGHYVVERYAVHTVPAVGVLQVTEDNEAAANAVGQRYLLVANPLHYPLVDKRPLPALPGTAVEAHGISRELRGEHVTLLEGREAGIDRMERSLPDATLLHLATHAVVSDSAPMTSFLALDRSEQGGMLTTAAVYGLHLHTKLVVLSACSTGRGQITGDGVAGLSRAFLYAGTASVMTTLWDVVDEPTASMMPKFYNELRRGASRSEALREAQLGLIRDLRAHKVKVETLAGTNVSLPESPLYWAAFSLSGQP